MTSYTRHRSGVWTGRGSRRKELNDRFRNDVVLGYQDGLTKYEIANKLKITVGEVVQISDMNREAVKAAKLWYSQHASEVEPVEKTSIVEEERGMQEKVATQNEPQTESQETEVILLDEVRFVGSLDSEKIGKNRKISDEDAIKILADLKENVLSQGDIAKMYGVSQSTVSAIKCGRGRFKLINMIQRPEEEVKPESEEKVDQEEMPTIADAAEIAENKPSRPKLTKKQRKRLRMKNEAEVNVIQVDDLMTVPALPPQGSLPMSDETAKEVQKAIDEAERLILNMSLIDKRTPVTHYLTCGMIANRHEIPTITYIFENNVNGSLMSNFTVQYEIAVNRLKELTEMQPDGSRKYDGVYMYVTGLTSVLASIIKACLALQLNLILLQYSPVDGSYHHQPMLVDFGHSENPCPPELEESYKCPIYTFGCTTQDFILVRNGYEVIEFVPGTGQQKEVTIFVSKEKALEFYDAKCSASSDTSVVINNIYIGTKNKLYVARTLKRIVNTRYVY